MVLSPNFTQWAGRLLQRQQQTYNCSTPIHRNKSTLHHFDNWNSKSPTMQKYKPLLHSNRHSSHTRFLFWKREEYFCNIIIMLVLRLEIEIIMISPHFAFSVFLQESGLLYSDSNKVRYFHLSLLFTHLLFTRMFKFFRFCFVLFFFGWVVHIDVVACCWSTHHLFIQFFHLLRNSFWRRRGWGACEA
jgi:hypothetical protein